MHYSAIKYNDIANGTGVRTVLFVSGCRNHCKECFQPETWDFKNGEEFTKEVEDEILASLESPYIKGLTLLGGDPFEPENQHALLPFIKRVRTEHPEKDIWAYTGYVPAYVTGFSHHNEARKCPRGLGKLPKSSKPVYKPRDGHLPDSPR